MEFFLNGEYVAIKRLFTNDIHIISLMLHLIVTKTNNSYIWYKEMVWYGGKYPDNFIREN